eukprot:scaffold5812_cov159-Skeletonema_dohrnii-CCMP3373.AAC.2
MQERERSKRYYEKKKKKKKEREHMRIQSYEITIDTNETVQHAQKCDQETMQVDGKPFPDADTTNKYLSREKDASILSWPTTMGHYKLWIVILEALDTIW